MSRRLQGRRTDQEQDREESQGYADGEAEGLSTKATVGVRHNS